MSDFEILRGNEAVSALSESVFPEETSSFFQSASWLRVWNARPGYESGLMVMRDGCSMVGYVPFCARERFRIRECYSMPRGTYGGPVILDSESQQICDRFVKWTDDNGFSRVNVVEYADRENKAFGSFRKTEHTTHVLLLNRDQDTLFDSLSDHHKRHLKKASRFEYEIVTVKSESDVRKYFYLAQESAERHELSAPYDLDFYLALHRNVSPNEIVWRLLTLDGTPCVGHICFRWANEVISWDGCSNRLGRATSVNYSLYWHNIRSFSEDGYASFNFGSSPRGVGGVIRFKTGWGSGLVRYFEYDRQTSIYRSASKVKGWFRP